MIREMTAEDWPQVWPFFDEIVQAGETYAYPTDLTSEQARALWTVAPPVTRAVAVVTVSVVLKMALLPSAAPVPLVATASTPLLTRFIWPTVRLLMPPVVPSTWTVE